MLSVIIPAKNEEFLEQTMRSILAAARGKIEIIAVLDGWLPDPQINIPDQRALFLPYSETIGQRAATNNGVKWAKGEYIMKIDAHCSVGEGFDLKLAEHCEDDWTVIPRMHSLHVFDWQCTTCRERWYQGQHKNCPKCGYSGAERKMIWQPRMNKIYDYGRIDRECRFQYWQSYKKRPEAKGDIVDVMCFGGGCFFMKKDRYWALEGLDEKAGPWGQIGVEISCKSWLSGGRMVVNKNTWHAHLIRSSLGWPYQISGSQIEQARAYSKDVWFNNRWVKQTRPFAWLIEKFNPPFWNGDIREEENDDQNIGELLPVVVSETIPYADQKTIEVRRQHGHIVSTTVSVEEMWKNHWAYHDLRKPETYKTFLITFREFMARVHLGEEFTDEELEGFAYYDYLISKLNPAVRDPLKPKGKRHVIKKMRDAINLYHNIKEHGLKNPIDVWKEPDGKVTIHRGGRRLEILHLLGYKKVPLRVFKSMDYFRMLAPSVHISSGDSMHNLGMKQFTEKMHLATDKYWVHDYLRLYDRHVGHLRNTAKKVLEFGVLRGASLLVWRDAFPHAQIYGVDKNTRKWEKHLAGQERIQVFTGRQEDIDFLNDKVIPAGPYDIIIDDCGHYPAMQETSFLTMWPHLNRGGWYILEDLYGNYWRVRGKETMIERLKGMIDDLNQKCEIKSMHFYYNICFIKKA